MFNELFQDEFKNMIFEILDEYFEENSVNESSASNEKYMRLEEVAEYTTLSKSLISKKSNIPLANGGIPSLKIGKTRIYVKSEIDRWLKNTKHREESYEEFSYVQ